MKIKGVIEDLKIKRKLKKEEKKKRKKRKKKRMILKIVKIYLGLSLVLLWAICGQFISDSFLVWLIFLKIYRPLPM